MSTETLQVEYVPLAELLPYARNSRTHSKEQVAQIAASIKEFGFTNPVLISTGNDIIAGHGRTMAAAQLKLETVPCIRLGHLTETQRRAYVIADNRLALNAGWDTKMLALELTDLRAVDFELDLLGFEGKELEALLQPVVDPNEGNGDPDDVPEQVETRAKPGDLWVLGNHRLLCGDSTNVQHIERLMAGEKVELVFTDPPYGIDYEGVNNDHLKAEKLREFVRTALSNVDLCMKPGAPYYVFHPDVHAYEFIGAIRDLEWVQARPSTIQWVKDSLILGRGDYHPRTEPILYGWKPGAAHFAVTDRSQDNVWEIPRPRSAEGHPTMKPVELVARAIKNSSHPGAVVADPFGGGGSTLIAAEQTGRRARLCELDPKYCDLILARWEKFTGKTASLEARADG